MITSPKSSNTQNQVNPVAALSQLRTHHHQKLIIPNPLIRQKKKKKKKNKEIKGTNNTPKTPTQQFQQPQKKNN